MCIEKSYSVHSVSAIHRSEQLLTALRTVYLFVLDHWVLFFCLPEVKCACRWSFLTAFSQTYRKQHVLECSRSIGITGLPGKDRYIGTGKRQRKKERCCDVYPWQRCQSMVFLEKCVMIAMEGKWIPCGVYHFVAMAPFWESHYWNARVCLCCVWVCVGDILSVYSLYPFSVKAFVWHRRTFIPTWITKSKCGLQK